MSTAEEEPLREINGVDAFAEASVLVSGLVYNADGQPLDNIEVAALPAEDPTADPVASALTYENGPDSHGAYVLQLPPGDYMIRFSTPEWRGGKIYRTAFYGGGSGEVVTVTEGSDLTLDDMVLQRENGVPVTGVVHGPDGTPLPQVEVALYRFWSDGDHWSVDWQVTDSQGRYTFPAVPRERSFSVLAYGGYDWDGTRLDYANTWLGDVPGSSAAEKFTLPTDSTGQDVGAITLRPGVRVHGTVAFPDSSVTDDVDLNLLLRNPDGTWDYVDYDYVGSWDDFGFEFQGVGRGAEYTIEFWSSELGTVTYLGGGTDRGTAQTFPLDDTSPAELDLGEILLGALTTRVNGSVVDVDGDGNYSDIQVWQLVDGTWEDYAWRGTDEDGSYRIRLPWNGTWTIEANPDSGASVFLGGGTSLTDPATETFTTAESVPTLALDPIVVPVDPPKAVGFVLDEHGAPVARARVVLWSSFPCDTGTCWDWWDSTRTNDNGRYVFRWLDDTVTYTVSAEKQNAGYDETFLGGGDAPETATTFTVASGEVRQLDDISFVLPPGVVRGTVTTEDGGTFDGGYVDLYRWEELSGSFELFDTSALDTGETRYAFNHLETGTYAVYAESWDWDDDQQEYLGTWRGGGAYPTSPTSPGTFEVTSEVNPLEGIDIELRRGILLTGTVTRGDGQPLKDTELSVQQWVDRGWGDELWSLAWGRTDAQGNYSLLVPKGADLFVSAYRPGYGDYYLGGSYPEVKDPANTLPTGTTDLTHDFGMVPAWGDVGAVAGVQDEDCLTHSWWWNDESTVSFDGRQLQIGDDGTIRLAQHEIDDLFADDARDPGLAPLQSWSDVTWGFDQGGERLCVLWNGWGSTRQAILETVDGPGLDVTYNYDSVPSMPLYPKAGWSAGEGPGGGQLVFAGWDAADGLGYTDANTETGLVHNSLNSEQPGRYQFRFDGFEPRAAAPVNTAAPTITGTLAVGETLTGGPGTWTIGGEPATGLEFDYRWFNVSGVPVGNTYVIESGDLGRRIWLEVRAWKPGHDWATAETMVRIPVGPPAATNTVPPSISPAEPTINQLLTADRGEWTVDGGTVDDLTFSYQWFRNGNRVSGATGETYTTLESDALKDITVRVKATRLDHAPVKVFSAPVTVGDLPAVQLVTAPELDGDPTVGATVAATSGAWNADGEPVTISYRFAADNLSRTADAGTPNAYTLKPTDQGRLLTVTVIAQAPGHRSTKWTRTIGPVAAGDTAFGQMTIEVVDDADGTPIAGAWVTACEQETWTCLPGSRTDSTGSWSGSAWAGVPYQVYVYPPEGTTFRSASRVVTVPVEGATTEIRLSEPVPPPPNVTIPTATGTYDGLPTVYWQESQTINITGCGTVASPTYTVTFTDGTPTQTGTLSMGAVGEDGLATFTATIPPFYPSHGETTISTNVPADCEPGTPPTAVSIYIDPSGVVTDQYGRTIEGATVTLQRADSAAGPYTTVPDGSAIMSEDNRTNPDLTDEVGFFRWDVVEGWYRVQVDASGCDSATTPGMPVLPARVDLLVKLTCDVSGPDGTPVVTGTPKVGETLTTDIEIWDSLFDVEVQWLRDGTPISGATETSYELTSADQGAVLSVRHVVRRPDYVQEEGRGTPVSFAPATRTSAATTAVAPKDAPVATTGASVTGSGKVGTSLTATPPTWDQSGVSNTIAWLRDGVVIAGESGSTYLVRSGDVGSQIRARYTGSKAGHTNGTSTSNAVTGVQGDAPTATTATQLTGSGKVGTLLSATAPTWNQTGVTNTVTWLRGGVAIAGESGSTYLVRSGDVGSQIKVRYTGSKAGHANGTSTSNAVTGVQGDAPTATTAAQLTGSGKVGTSLTATPPVWNLLGVANTVTWLRDEVVIAGASGSSYTVLPGDVGSEITVRYTGSKAGHANGSSTSSAVTAVLADAPTATSAASLAGSGKVGSSLTATAPTWNQSGVANAVTWLRDGVAIAGASGSTYTMQPGDVGSVIRARYTGTKAGYADGTSTSNAVTAVLADAPTATSAASLAGSGKVGSSLTATAPTWNQSGVANSVTWLRDGVVIAGASGPTYTVLPGDVGSEIRVRYTGTKAGHADGTSTSSAVTAVLGDAPTTTAPVVTGTPKVGQMLSATAAAWSFGGVTTGYQWLRDGVPIDGATASSYTLVTQDAARSISVRVIGTKAGYQTGEAVSDEVVVAKLKSRTVAKLPKPKVPASKTAKVVVVVKVPGVANPKGVVKIKKGKKVIAKGTLGKGGKAVIKLPKLTKGKHKLGAFYSGGPTIAKSKSKVVTLTIT